MTIPTTQGIAITKGHNHYSIVRIQGRNGLLILPWFFFSLSLFLGTALRNS